MSDARLEQEIRDALRTESGRRIDVDRAWGQFQRRRQEAGRRHSRWLAMAAAAAVVVVAAIVAAIAPVLAGRLHGSPGNAAPSGRTSPGAHHRSRLTAGTYQDAIAARIPVGHVISMASNGDNVWAMTPSELVRIDARTNRVTLREHIPRLVNGELISAGGALWLDECLTPGHAGLLRIDPAAGVSPDVPGGCGPIAYGLGHLWMAASARHGMRILRIDPATGRVDAHTGTIHGTADSLVAGPAGIWYSTSSGVAQVNPSGTGLIGITVNDSGYPFTLSGAGLALGQGAVWALSGDENIARIDPATGRITGVVNYRSVDPTHSFEGGLFLDTGQGSLWLLADRGQTQVLRVSMSAGQLLGRVNVGDSCGQPCHQIYDALGSVWVPSAKEIVRIDPARMPS